MRPSEVTSQPINSRRRFLRSASFAAATTCILAEAQFAVAGPQATPSINSTEIEGIEIEGTESQAASAQDEKRMRELAAWTALTMETPNPVPFGADIVHSQTGESLLRATNAVGPEHDPSAHAEVRTIRLACKKINAYSLKGYTLYTTCEPCPMCMGCALWAGLDRVVFGATISDAARFGPQIEISAAEVVKRSDMKCSVVGPVERDACLALFTNPNMQETFKRWNSQRR
jgi:tRNA(Arg) A34 adenosine deaminase TadA